MSTPKKGQAELLAERRERFIEYIKADLNPVDIAAREGMDADDVRKKRIKVAREEDLSLGSGAVKDAAQYGLGKLTHAYRSRLADHLHRLRLKHHPIEVAQLTGISRKSQNRAVNNPFNHDWTLAQMERMAIARGITFEELKNAPTD